MRDHFTPTTDGRKSAKDIWETAKGALQVQVNRANYETWLKDTVGISYKGNQFVVGTPRAFAKEWLERRLLSLVKKTLISIMGHSVEVTFQVCEATNSVIGEGEPSRQAPGSSQPRLPLPGLNPRYTFESFVVGTSNRLAFAAAVGVTEDPGHHHNPLFIYGGCGLGKTHLVHAIGNEACENGLTVGYASGEQFTTEFVNSIREKTTNQFRRKFRNVDLLIIEDIQFIQGKQQTQISLFHTLDELHNSNRQVVVTGNRPPVSMPSMEKALCSRLQCGLVTQVRIPDPETRLSILRLKAQRQKVVIDQAVFDFIAQTCQTSVRELEGHLTRLIAYAKVTRRTLSLEIAREALAVLQDGSPQDAVSRGFTPLSILNAVANHFSVTPESIQGKRRDSRSVLARRVAIYLIREETNCPLNDIGRFLGGRNHSTILRGYQRMSDTAYADPSMQRNIDQIMKALGA